MTKTPHHIALTSYLALNHLSLDDFHSLSNRYDVMTYDGRFVTSLTSKDIYCDYIGSVDRIELAMGLLDLFEDDTP